MVGVHVDDIIVSGKQDMCDELFGQLKQRFPVKNLGELNMYTSCVLERDWDSGIVEMNRTAFVKKNGETVQHSRNLEYPGKPRCRSRAKKRWRVRG